jgi:hypothetical protein
MSGKRKSLEKEKEKQLPYNCLHCKHTLCSCCTLRVVSHHYFNVFLPPGRLVRTKCDKTYPACRRCVRKGLTCTGFTNKPKRGRPRKPGELVVLPSAGVPSSSQSTSSKKFLLHDPTMEQSLLDGNATEPEAAHRSHSKIKANRPNKRSRRSGSTSLPLSALLDEFYGIDNKARLANAGTTDTMDTDTTDTTDTKETKDTKEMETLKNIRLANVFPIDWTENSFGYPPNMVIDDSFFDK